MTESDGSAAPIAAPKPVRFGKAVRRFGPYVWRYRGRAFSVLILGLITGLLAKAPFVFLAPFIDSVLELGPRSDSAPAGETHALQKFSVFIRDLQPDLAQWLPASFGQREKISLVLVIGLGVIVVTILGAIAQLAFQQLSRGLSLRILADIRQDLAAHILKLGMHFHTSARKGDLLSRATNDVNIVLTALALCFDDLVLEPAQLLGNAALAVASDPQLTILVLFLLPVLIVPLLIFGRRVRKGTRRSLAALGESTEAMSQMFSGIRVVKAFRMEDRELEEFRRANERWIDRAMSVVRAKALTDSSTHLLTYAGFAVLICALGLAHLTTGAFRNMGSFGVWFIAFSTMYVHIRRVSKGYQTIQESLGAAERLFEILDQKPPESVSAVGQRRLDGPVRSLEFEGVTFGYGGDRVLDDVSFRADAGQTIAIVGPSGGGKSTLIDLVARFYSPQSGRILVNGIDISQLDPEVWYGCWALVDQQPFLFHVSIRENVAYGKRDATDDEIRAALRAANLLDFVEALPEGIATEVGDRGARLSGGQRQRLTIARALLKNPPILLLDEATSALDSESEAAVQEALERLMVGRTSLVVAHRLSTIRSATRILVLESGKIVEHGRHEELLRSGGAYRRLYDMQRGWSEGE